MICIYHSKDLDGFSSGAIVLKKYPGIKLIGYDYGQNIPEIPDNSEIILVDVSFPMSEMVKISKRTKSFIWIDHHISAINEFNNLKEENSIITFLDVNYSACELTWRYFFNENIPTAIEMLGKYDTWRKDEFWQTKILPFQYGMRLICNSPESFPSYLFDAKENNFSTTSIIEDGLKLIQYQKAIDSLSAKNSFEINFEGYKAICLNTSNFSSQTFESVYDENKHDLMIPFQWSGQFWKFSLYTTKSTIDCSVLAKKYGGGGHKGAAGFQLNDLSIFF